MIILIQKANQKKLIIAGICLFVLSSLLVMGCQKKKALPSWGDIGKSSKGTSIRMAELGDGLKTIIYLGVMHGDEPIGKPLLEMLFDRLKSNPKLYEKKRVIIVPVINPDGLARNTRFNGNRVDINRNMPTKNWVPDNRYSPGNRPASEAETAILVKLIDEKKPSLMIVIHQGLDCINYDGPATLFAEKLVQITGLPLKHSVGYSTPGSIGTYAGIERAIPTITFEFPNKYIPIDIDRKYFPAILETLNFQQ